VRRVFVPDGEETGGRVVLTGDEAHYLLRVLRLRPGDRFRAVTRAGAEHVATIASVTADAVEALLGEKVPARADPSAHVRLYVGLPKWTKLEMLLQKCTELGVSVVQPVVCRRSIPRPEQRDIGHKLIRWQRIAEGAARQSERTAAPHVQAPVDLAVALADAEALGGTRLVLTPWADSADEPGCRLIAAGARGPVSLLTGPEGGLAPEEVDEAIAAGFRPVSLGPRVLRAETAAIVACALVMRELGELG
jgi:16S rRNA (uracil1498-N3)-methyltransferase